MIGTTAALIGLGTLFAGKTVYDVHKGNMAERDARNAASEAEYKQNKLMEEAKARRDKEELQANLREQGMQAQAAQRAKMSSYQGRQSTILTGPLGLPNPPTQPPAGGKTLLGT